MRERRRCPRQPWRRWGTLRAGNLVQQCLIKDVSPLGARVALAGSLRPDQEFDLQLASGSPLRRCRVIWSAGKEGGVAFLTNPAAEDWESFLLEAPNVGSSGSAASN